MGVHNRLGNAFSKVFPLGWKKWVIGVNGGITYVLERGSAKTGFVHIIRRHLAQFYDGTLSALGQVTHFWPTATRPKQVVRYLEEALYKIGAHPPLLPGESVRFVTKATRLDNGILVKVVLRITRNSVSIHSFFPTGGPGVTTIQEIIARGLL